MICIFPTSPVPRRDSCCCFARSGLRRPQTGRESYKMGRRDGRSRKPSRSAGEWWELTSACLPPREPPLGFQDSELGDGKRTGMASRSSSQSLESVLLLLGWHLVHTALGTTVIPLCGVNETENCTTAVVQMESSPHTPLPEKQVECKPEWHHFCFNGECRYSDTLKQYYCRCHKGFTGERCSHSSVDLVKKPFSNEYLALTIILCLFFFSAVLLYVYFYKKHQNKKQRLGTSKNYEEVASEKDHKLLPV